MSATMAARYSSPAERRLWIACGLYLAAIYASLYLLPFCLDFLRSRNLLRLSLAAFFGLLAAGVAAWAARNRAGPREWAVLLGAGALYAYFLSRMEILQERLHVPEYGVLALLVHAALARRWGETGLRRRPPLLAVAVAVILTGAAGWGDEGIQALLPNRVYDLRDVAFNTLAGAAALVTLLARDEARRRDHPAPA